ncbi:SHOCT domain-containing protein [Halomarina halobia]|uniref:SHOCT domain-containing protein n=1 Tax=Halomarina halobia TaxID=3033386 RepID=A0ABD6ABJ4_9EURY|nr:SHOCT domain-containing protein [Halomarina sp. PSR21]
MTGVVGWVRRHHVGVLAVSLLVVTALLVGVLGIGTLVALASLTAPLDALADAVLPWAVAALLLAALALCLVAALAWALVRRLSLPKSQRAADLAARIERHNHWARSVGLSAFVAPPRPTTDDRIDDLTRRYVDGDLSEAEFERRVGSLVDDEDRDRMRGSRGTRVGREHDERRRGRERERARGR